MDFPDSFVHHLPKQWTVLLSHSLHNLSCERSIAYSKVSFLQRVIYCFLFQVPVIFSSSRSPNICVHFLSHLLIPSIRLQYCTLEAISCARCERSTQPSFIFCVQDVSFLLDAMQYCIPQKTGLPFFPLKLKDTYFHVLFFGRQQRAAVVPDDLTVNCEHAFCTINVANMKYTECLTVYFLLQK